MYVTQAQSVLTKKKANLENIKVLLRNHQIY